MLVDIAMETLRRARVSRINWLGRRWTRRNRWKEARSMLYRVCLFILCFSRDRISVCDRIDKIFYRFAGISIVVCVGNEYSRWSIKGMKFWWLHEMREDWNTLWLLWKLHIPLETAIFLWKLQYRFGNCNVALETILGSYSNNFGTFSFRELVSFWS